MVALQPITLGLGLVDLYARLDATRVEAQKVSGKQDAFDLSGLLSSVSSRALQSDFVALQQSIALIEASLSERIASRATQSDLSAVQRDLTFVQASLNSKADGPRLQALIREVGLKASQSAVDALARILVGRAAQTDFVAVRDRAPPSVVKPGDGARSFSFGKQFSGFAGEADVLPPLPDDLLSFNPAGGVLRIAGPGIVVAREAEPVETGRIRAIRARVSRYVDSPDPNNDAVVFGVIWLDQTKQVITTAIAATIPDLVAASGRQTRTAYVSATSGPGITLLAPVGAAYFRRYIQTFGSGGVVDIETLASDDVTGQTLPPPASASLVADVDALKSLNAGPRLGAVESAVNAPSSVSFATVDDAVAGVIPSTASTVLTRGRTLPGDNLHGLYVRVPAGQAGLLGFVNVRDNSNWKLVGSNLDRQFKSPLPTPHVRHIFTDPHRHVAGRIIDWGNGRQDYIYRSAYRHHIDFNAEIRAITSRDGMLKWSEERTIISGTGTDLGGDVGFMTSTPQGDRYILITPALKPDPNDPSKTFSETPVAYTIAPDDTAVPTKLVMENGSIIPGFGLVAMSVGEYRAGSPTPQPDITQIIFYGGGNILRAFYNHATAAFSPIKIICPAGSGPANAVLGESVVGYDPLGRGYMLTRNSISSAGNPYQGNELRRPLLISFSTVVNGEEVWSRHVHSKISFASVPPYLYPAEPRQHFFYTRSVINGNVSQNHRGNMVALNIDPLVFIETKGDKGYSANADGSADWAAVTDLESWAHIQGGWTKLRDGTVVFAVSYGESGAQASTTQGTPCRLGVITTRPGPAVSPYVMMQAINSGIGREESYNSGVAIWSLGKVRRSLVTASRRLEACDGISIRRSGGALKAWVMCGDDGVQEVMRIGRDPDDISTAPINITGALFGEDLRHLRGKWVTFCHLFKPGPNFSCVNNALTMTILAGSDPNVKITGADGSFPDNTCLITPDGVTGTTVKLLDVSRQRYSTNPFSAYVPYNTQFLSYVVTWAPAGASAEGDYLDCRRVGFVNGDQPTQHILRPLDEYRERCLRILQSTYPRDVPPGTPETFAGSLAGRRDTGIPAEYVRWDYRPMVRAPTKLLISPKDGALNRVWANTANVVGALLNETESSIALSPTGALVNGQTYNGHVLLRCAAWAVDGDL